MGGLRVEGSALVAVAPEAVRPWIADLATYPRWLGIVLSATPLPADSATPLPADGPAPAWTVELGARVGPLRRAKRLRMVRTVDAGESVQFTRDEGDGRTHGVWVLEATVAAADPGHTALTMRLRYEGASPWLGLLEPVLRQEINRAPARLHDALLRG